MPSEATTPFEWIAADPRALASAFKESGAAAAPPSPDWSEYAARLTEGITDWLGNAMGPLVHALGPNAGAWLGWLVVALAFVLVIVIVARLIRALGREPQSLGLTLGKSLARVRVQTPEEYRRLALASLERGDTRFALTSAWWWFAAAALKDGPDPAMTTYDVITRSGRNDLREPARVLDRLRFGAMPPTLPEVRRLLGDLEARV